VYPLYNLLVISLHVFSVHPGEFNLICFPITNAQLT
jgi:hypothetical protein